MSEAEEKIEVVVDAKANDGNEASGGDGAIPQNQVDNGSAHEDDTGASRINSTDAVVNLGNGEKTAVQGDVILNAVGNSAEQEPKSATPKKIELERWNGTKCCLLVFFIVLFLVWAAAYFAYDQGYFNELIKLIK